jgi:hypothetical protein
MKPISQPAALPQPNQEVYGTDALALFQTFTRDRYRSVFGVEAPAWDPSRPGKAWFDSTVDGSMPGNVAAYKMVDRDASGVWSVLPFSMTAFEAANVNLPGAIVYPPYSIAPTGATRGGSAINPLYLSLEADGRSLMTALAATSLIDEGATTIFPVVYPPEELRRMWSIVLPAGRPVNVGTLMQMRSAKGVGAPGHWDLSSGDPVWVAAPPPPTGFDDTRPPRPVPVRDLLPNEKLQPGVMGFGVEVLRTDLQLEAAKQSGAFTGDDRKMLQEVYRIVSKLGI